MPHQEEVLSRPQEEADGAHQEAQEEEEGGSAQREARRRQDPPQGHDHRPGDDWLRRRGVQRKDLQPGRDQGKVVAYKTWTFQLFARAT